MVKAIPLFTTTPQSPVWENGGEWFEFLAKRVSGKTTPVNPRIKIFGVEVKVWWFIVSAIFSILSFYNYLIAKEMQDDQNKYSYHQKRHDTS